MRYERGVLGVADDEAGDACGRAVAVERVGLFFDVLTDAGAGAFGYGFGEHGHELAVGVAGEAGEGGEVAFHGEFGGGLRVIAQDLKGRVRRAGVARMVVLTPM